MWPTDQWATQLASSRFAYFQIVYFSQARPRGARSCCSSCMPPGQQRNTTMQHRNAMYIHMALSRLFASYRFIMGPPVGNHILTAIWAYGPTWAHLGPLGPIWALWTPLGCQIEGLKG